MAYLVNPGARNLELSDLITTYLGIFLSEVSGDLFSDFRPEAAVWCFKIESKLKKELTDRNMLRLYEELELPTLIRLAELEQNGISVNKNELTSMHKSLVSEVEKETKSAHQSAGHEFNVASPKQLQSVLFDELKLPKTKKIKTGFTTDAESLEWLFQKTKHPILQNLLRIREATKLATTIEGLITAADFLQLSQIFKIFQFEPMRGEKFEIVL
jgi:DNA polymerase-1